jgi:hypothetical protein
MATLIVDPDDDAAVLGEGFVRLPNAPRIEPNEDYNVVRVEVPGSAMIEAGISLSEDRAAENGPGGCGAGFGWHAPRGAPGIRWRHELGAATMTRILLVGLLAVAAGAQAQPQGRGGPPNWRFVGAEAGRPGAVVKGRLFRPI